MTSILHEDVSLQPRRKTSSRPLSIYAQTYHHSQLFDGKVPGSTRNPPSYDISSGRFIRGKNEAVAGVVLNVPVGSSL
jgi:hypothetical protein